MFGGVPLNSMLCSVLVCPVCLESLEASVESWDREDVVTGRLACSRCGRRYPIWDGIPRMISSGDPAAVASERDTWLGKRGDQADAGPNTFVEHERVRYANIRYYDLVAGVYEADVEQAVHQTPENQKRIEEIVARLACQCREGPFVDVGCGTGNVLKLASKYFAPAIGVDTSVGMLAVARQRGLNVVQADAAFLPFASGFSRAISVFSVLHHLYDPRHLLFEAARVLGHGGVLYTDWDPQRQPAVEDGLVWQALRTVSRLARPVRISAAAGAHESAGRVDFKNSSPSIKKTYELAEFHNLSREVERGLDPVSIRRILETAGFSSVDISYHWGGTDFRDLPLSLKVRLLTKALLSHRSVERWMENFMVIARRG